LGVASNKNLKCLPCSALEGEFMAGEAESRWRVLALVASFDCAMFVVRAVAKVISGVAIGSSLAAQLANMALLYSLTAVLNARSRRLGSKAAQQVGLAGAGTGPGCCRGLHKLGGGGAL